MTTIIAPHDLFNWKEIEIKTTTNAQLQLITSASPTIISPDDNAFEYRRNTYTSPSENRMQDLHLFDIDSGLDEGFQDAGGVVYIARESLNVFSIKGIKMTFSWEKSPFLSRTSKIFPKTMFFQK